MNLFSDNINQNIDIDIKIPWIEKYRPTNAEEILLEPFIKDKINNILLNKSIPNMIITGEPGTGKTSTILFLAKEIYKNYYNDNVLELNASDDRGLLIINNKIYPFCKKKILQSDIYHKLVILDEADSITSKAQNVLSNIISEFRSNTRFVFICNDCSQIIESIQSRCMIIKYPKISQPNLQYKILNICNNENIKYDNLSSIDALLFVSDYDIRQAINNLECIYYALNELTEENIYKIIDKPKLFYISNILKSCYDKKFNDAIKIVSSLYNKGYTPNDILLTIMKYLMMNNNDLSEENKIKMYEITSHSYITINEGIDTLLQLCCCISKIYQYINNL
jgi:replication factor C subunit 2/4